MEGRQVGVADGAIVGVRVRVAVPTGSGVVVGVKLGTVVDVALGVMIGGVAVGVMVPHVGCVKMSRVPGTIPPRLHSYSVY